MTSTENELATTDPSIDSTDLADAGEGEHVLADSNGRSDYVHDDGITAVSVYGFADGTGLKAWTADGGKTYTTRNVDERGRAIMASTTTDMTIAEVNAQIATNAFHAAKRAERLP